MLVIKPEWLEMILAGDKCLEIRGSPTDKVGQRIYLAASGAPNLIVASVYLSDCIGPLSAVEWEALRPGHCVPGGSGYHVTYAYRFDDLVRYHWPVPYARKHGVVTWENVPLAKELRHV